MATSLAFCANTGISLLDGPTVTHEYSGHQPTHLLAPQISTAAASRSSSRPTMGSPATEGRTLDSSISVKDVP